MVTKGAERPASPSTEEQGVEGILSQQHHELFPSRHYGILCYTPGVRGLADGQICDGASPCGDLEIKNRLRNTSE